MLILLATVHLDAKGRERLRAALNQLAPDAVLLEHTKAWADALRVRPVPEAVQAFLLQHQVAKEDYVPPAAEAYCTERQVPLLYAGKQPGTGPDAPFLSPEELNGFNEVLQQHQVPLQQILEMQYGLTKEIMPMIQQQMEELNAAGSKPLLLPADQVEELATAVREACSQYRKIVFVCTVYHVFTLEAALADLQPEVLKINAY